MHSALMRCIRHVHALPHCFKAARVGAQPAYTSYKKPLRARGVGGTPSTAILQRNGTPYTSLAISKGYTAKYDSHLCMVTWGCSTRRSMPALPHPCILLG